MKKTILLILLVFSLFNVSNAQNKTLKGYLCGLTEGNAAGIYYLRVGTKVVQISHLFSSGAGGQWGKTTRYIGMEKKNTFKNGAEYVVKYRTESGGEKSAVEVKFTGILRKNTKPCSVK